MRQPASSTGAVPTFTISTHSCPASRPSAAGSAITSERRNVFGPAACTTWNTGGVAVALLPLAGGRGVPADGVGVRADAEALGDWRAVAVPVAVRGGVPVRVAVSVAVCVAP